MAKSLLKRVLKAYEQNKPSHVLATKMSIGVTTVNEMLKGNLPKQNRVLENINTFLDENGF